MAEAETEVMAEGKTAHPIELFFDLVYVFGFTRVVGFIVHDHNLESALKGALILGLLWWSWGTWTWSMNAVDLTNRFRRVLILVAMIAIFVMGYSVPTAFDDGALWMAAGYTASRILAGVVMWFGTLDDPVEHQSVRRYLPISLISPALVIVGAFMGGSSLVWLWVAALAVEVVAALSAGSSEWHVDAEHFAERHGLIMIIALGEAIIAVGVALTNAAGEDIGPSAAVVWRLAVGIVGVGAMWWAYFDKLQVIWERRLHEADTMITGALARDIYSLAHYPMLVGIVFYAVALEEAFLHPADPLSGFTRWMLAVSIALYFLSPAAAMYRAHGAIMRERILGVAIVVVLTASLSIKGELAILIVTFVLIATMSAEYWRFRDEVRGNAALRR